MTAVADVYNVLAQMIRICVAHGVQKAVLCPGSRSAPIALTVLRNADIQHYILADERSAAYAALGMAQQTQRPVLLVCTSGTAALNFAPAIAEAFFSQIPLIVLTADRPPEWIGQADNQSIHQSGLYGAHVLASFNLPLEFKHPDAAWHAERIFNEALLLAKGMKPGPVHINIPLREPLYIDQVLEYAPARPPRIIQEHRGLLSPSKAGFKVLAEELDSYKKVLIVAGSLAPNDKLLHSLGQFTMDGHFVLLPDITSNLCDVPGAVCFFDLILDGADNETLDNFIPDLIISFGGPIVSKQLKQLLRRPEVRAHWHIGENPAPADTFQHLTKIIPLRPEVFFKAIHQAEPTGSRGYSFLWHEKEAKIRDWLRAKHTDLPWSESAAMVQILGSLPSGSILHLGNSLPIRHAAFLPLLKAGTVVFSNRGTSGIDGSLSTAAGHTLASQGLTNTLITGDLSFLYDRNGLWNNYLDGRLKIIIFNNYGGRIFESLPGAAQQPEIQEYFVTNQPLNFKETAGQHGLPYLHGNDMESLPGLLYQLYSHTDKPAILELNFGTDLPNLTEIKRMIRLEALGLE